MKNKKYNTFVRLLDGIVVDEISGLERGDKGWVKVIVVDDEPTQYPKEFYFTPNNKPTRTVIDGVVQDTTIYQQKDIATIKSELYTKLKKERDLRFFGEITVGEINLPINDEKDIQAINNLNGKAVRFKLGTRNRVDLTNKNSLDIKDIFDLRVQESFAIEEAEEEKVFLCETHQQLADYIKVDL